MLVVVGAQLMGTFVKLLGTDPGFQADHIFASVVLPAGDRYPTPGARASLYAKLLDSIQALPGVDRVGTVDALPFSGENHGGLVTGSESEVMEPNHQPAAEIDVVSSEYLQTMGVRLLAGRWFTQDDMKDSVDTVMVNDFAASRLWPGADPIGKRICLLCTPEKPNNWKQVVGVVTSIQHAAMDRPPGLDVYVASRSLERAVFLVARSSRNQRELGKAIRRAVASVDPNQPVFISVSLRTLIADSLADRRFIMILLTATGLLALVISVAGVYGVSSYAASRRTHEIGVRMALGATRRHVLGLIFRHGFFTTSMGLVLGLALTIALLRMIRAALAGLESGPAGYVVIAVVLVSLTAAVACWFPARRASKIEPISHGTKPWV